MKWIPKPHKIIEKEEIFVVKENFKIFLACNLEQKVYTYAKILQQEMDKTTGICPQILKVFSENEDCNSVYLKNDKHIESEEGYILQVFQDKILLRAKTSRGFLYGVATLIQMLREEGHCLSCVEIEDAPDFKHRGFMLDIARGRVPKLSYLKKLAERLALYKINQLQLYVESGVDIPELREVCVQSDVLTFEEIMEFDRYCQELGIELVPCIATFGHLYDMLRTETYAEMSEMGREVGEPFTWYHRMRYHILDVTNEQSYNIIWKILMKYLPLFSSKKVNICCDETFDLGKGKSKELVEKEGYAKVYYKHVNRLAKELQKLGYNVMIWADIVLNHKEEMERLNSEVTCLNWYYYYNEQEENISIFEKNGKKQYVCPSVSGYSRLVNAFDLAYVNVKEMAVFGKKYHAEGLLNTDWGDTGHVNMPALAIPGMIYGAAMSWNADDIRTKEEMDCAISCVEYGDPQQKMVGLLRKLSQQDLIIFNDLTFFRDFDKYHLLYDDLGPSLYEDAKQRMMEMSEEKLWEAVHNCEEIMNEFLHMQSPVRLENRECREFYLSAKGVKLCQETVLALKENNYGQKLRESVNVERLALNWEEFFTEYQEVWRETSKESELFRIKEFLVDICKILRRNNRD